MSFQSLSSRLFTTSLVAVGFSISALPALALDGDDFATKLASVMGQGGATMSFSAVETDGDAVTVRTARLSSPGQPDIALGDITFEGVEERGDGGYTAERADFQDIEFEQDEARVTVKDIGMTGLTVPATSDFSSLNSLLFYSSFSTGPVEVTIQDTDVFSADGMSMRVDRSDDLSSYNMLMSVSSIRIALDIPGVPRFDPQGDPTPGEVMKSLGYEEIAGDLTFNALWDVQTGTIDVREYALSLDEIGRFSMNFTLTGYTLELIEAMANAQKMALKNPDQQAAQNAMGMAMLGLMQQLNFVSASLSFEDYALTERLLDYYGSQQGVTGEQMSQGLKALIPLTAGQLGIPALQKQIAAAANTYLDDPGSLTLTLKPAEPLPFPMIMGAGMGDPRSLVDLFNVEVEANTR